MLEQRKCVPMRSDVNDYFIVKCQYGVIPVCIAHDSMLEPSWISFELTYNEIKWKFK